VVRTEIAQRSDLGLSAVSEVGDDFQAYLVAGVLDDDLRRLDLDAIDLAALGHPGSAGRDPLAQHLILPGALGEASPAFVRDRADRFQEQQAGFGVRRIDPPAHVVARDGVDVLLRLEAEERQTETALALERAVAASEVAPGPAEHAHDVLFEIDLLDF